MRQLAEVEAELIQLESSYQKKKQSALSDLQSEVYELKAVLNDKRLNLQINNEKANKTHQQKESLATIISALRDEWHKANSLEFEFSQEGICPTCGQDIPAYQLEETREKALAAFNLKKAKQLEEITERGKALAKELDEKKDLISDLENKNSVLVGEIDDLEKEFQAIVQQTEDVESKFSPLSDDPKYKELLHKQEEIKSAIVKLSEDNKDQVAAEQAIIGQLENKIQSLQPKLSARNQIEKAQSRIEELQAEERRYAAEFEKLEEELFLPEEFVRAKVRLLEDKINSRFEFARFKLFEIQVNGGLAECCETTFHGVPYSDLNNAARINVGLDIINTLSKHHQFSAPIWIDNAESVTQLSAVDAQVIRLIVSEQDKELRVVIAQKPKATKQKEAV